MTLHASIPGPRRCAGPASGQAGLPAALLCLLLLAGCAMPGSRGVEEAAVAPPPVPSDPIVAFAAQAQPGAQGRVVLPDGRPASVRLLRSYQAASGRECREVLVGTGTAQRAQLVCLAENGSWAVARPLLRGAGTTR